MGKLLIFVIPFFYSQITLSQKINFTVTEIDSIVKFIDSTSVRGGITDFILHKKGSSKKVIGGGSDWYYTDTSRDYLMKVIREVSLQSDNIDSYYFYQDSLIYLLTTQRAYHGGKKKINTSGRYYFQNHTLIFKQDNLKYSFNSKSYFEAAKQFFDKGQIWRKTP